MMWHARRTGSQFPPSGDEESAEQSSSSLPRKSAREYPFKHAFDFVDGNCTMILEMPVEMLDDDAALADAWVDVVSWARMSWLEVQQGKPPVESPSEPESTLDESEITREHLEDALRRLHDAAERRRQLRDKLAEQQNTASNVPSDD